MSCECYECLKKAPKSDFVPKSIRVFNAFIICSECGNKRCPKATDHRLACTGSNEPGQSGSRYGVYPHPSIELIDFIERGTKKKPL